MFEEPTNNERADWAHTALAAFADETCQDTSGDLEHEIGSVIGDLMCNLYHLCDQQGIPHSHVDHAKDAYEEEVSLEQEEQD
jgi:hypothetical protein